jgi:uncharacterized protein YjbJ (UPF0337 family)
MKNDIEKKLEQAKGNVKETTGKIIGSEQLELEGKLKKLGGKLSEAGSEIGENIKEKTAGKVNDLLDDLQDKVDKKKNK